MACIIASMTRSGILESRPAWWSEVLIGYLKVLSVPCLISPKCENLFLSSDVTFSQCHPQTLKMKTFAEVKTSWKWRTGQEVLITSTYNFSSTPNCSHIRPQYDYSSILCHIHWVCTQEAAQTSSSLQDIYCLLYCFSTHHALQHDMQVTGEQRSRCAPSDGNTARRAWNSVHCCLQLWFNLVICLRGPLHENLFRTKMIPSCVTEAKLWMSLIIIHPTAWLQSPSKAGKNRICHFPHCEALWLGTPHLLICRTP